MKILVCDEIPEKGLAKLRAIPKAKVAVQTGLPPAQLAEAVKECEGIVVRSGSKITEEVLQRAGKLRAIARAGMGYDNIDLEAATKRGVIVMNTPGSNAVTTAEHAIAMMMALARNIPQAHASLHAGKWDRKKFIGTELAGKTLGVIGLGNVGREVSRRARGLKMEVLGYDPFISETAAAEAGAQWVSLQSLYEKSDFITIHTMLNESTRHMIGKDAFAKMKNRVRLINCARGEIVDESALLHALNSGKVVGAALDVFENEPLPADHPLLRHERVITTPHLGASTDEAQEQVALAAADQLYAYFVDGLIINAVNVPNVSREVLATLGPYINLAERLGSLLGQLGAESIQEVRVECAGEITKYDTAAITSAALKGLMSHLSSVSVNFVNALPMAKERGIRISELRTQEAAGFTSMVTAGIRGGKEEHLVSGSVFGRKYERLVRFNQFYMEVLPKGHLLLIENVDKPGVVGKWGTILGANKVNISQMQVALDEQSKKALAVVNIDSAASPKVIQKLRAVTDIRSVRQVKL
ncbi:MAG TPA: phosphoglycerate dehydrogenase [Bdellovibrionota bacterium]|nr:phosphoglycerate dehydrogenase [Bdellovibrionota bacterium]